MSPLSRYLRCGGPGPAVGRRTVQPLRSNPSRPRPSRVVWPPGLTFSRTSRNVAHAKRRHV
eukprot:5172045-Prymnesium_polylepis.1